MEKSMIYHMLSFFFGFLLDLLLGDPYWMPHPVRLIGNFIDFLDKRLIDEKKDCKKEFKNGMILVILVSLCTVGSAIVILCLAYHINVYTGVLLETVMTYQILATKCLKLESMKVYQCLKKGSLEEARKAVAMIVGRDTENLSETGVTKAAVETVAENTSDGIIAPMLYTALGGPVLGFLYKAVNTMDSMIGYRNDRYLYFGRAAAKLDDVFNYLPARISAMLMLLACFFLGRELDARNAAFIFHRDRYKHASPNSAQTEAVCAGALQIQLAGNASYFGIIKEKPFIGDPVHEITYEDIKRANRLMYATAILCEILCLAVLAGVGALLFI